MRAFLLSLLAGAAFAATPRVSLPLYFEPNVGQTDPSVRYLARTSKATLWLTEDGPVFGLVNKSRVSTMKLRFEGANRKPAMEAEDRFAGVTNVFGSNDRSQWRTHIPQYGRVRYRDLYPGIDLVFYGNPQQIEYDFVVAPGADPSRIRMVFDGADRVSEDSGDLVVKIAGTELRNKKPVIRQGESVIEGHYAIHGKRRAGFVVDGYDHSRPLVIDPAITYLSYLGGQNGDDVSGIAIDAQGNLIIVGSTNSPNFPIKNPLFKLQIQQGGNLAFASAAGYVAKINPSASGANSLIWATFFGIDTTGEQTFGLAVTLDKPGNIYISGETSSASFPLQNAIQKTLVNNHDCSGSEIGSGNPSNMATCPDAIVMKLSPGGDALLFSTYLGGAGHDSAAGIAVDAAGNIVVAGETQSPGFPIRGNAHQNNLRGVSDGFVCQISPNFSILYASYVGGEDFDLFNKVAVDAAGNIYAIGSTRSLRAPTSPGAFQTTRQGTSYDAYVVEINPNQTFGSDSLVWGTYLGGTQGNTVGNAITLGANGKVYVAGGTNSATFPTTSGAISSTYHGSLGFGPFDIFGDAYVAEFNPAANGAAQLVYSTYLGGSFDDEANAIAVDSAGFVTVAGGTNSPDFPTTIAAFQYFFPGTENNTFIGTPGFITRFDPSTGKGYSTFIGGSTSDAIGTLALDSTGNVVAFGGQTASLNLPVTASALQSLLADANHPPGIVGTVGAGNGWFGRLDFSVNGPIIFGYENGASLGADTIGTLAPGLLFTIKGLNLGPDTPSGAQLDANGKISTTNNGVQVFAAGLACPITYVSSTQINAIVPYELAAGVGFAARIQSVYNGVSGTILSINIAATSPGILSLGDGTGQGVILNLDGTLADANHPAKIGSTVIIFGTGEGVTSPACATGGIADPNNPPKPTAKASLSIGGVPVTNVPYLGSTPGIVCGLLQINAVVPDGVTPGNAVPVILTVGSASSQKGLTMAVSQ